MPEESERWIQWEYIAPSDWVTGSILGIVSIIMTIGLLVTRNFFGIFALVWAFQVALFIGFCFIIYKIQQNGQKTWCYYARGQATVFPLLMIYISLGWVVFDAIPWSSDPWLAGIDTAIFGGTSPVLWLEQNPPPGGTNFWAFIYVFFVAYLYISIFMGLNGWDPKERQVFLTGFALAYAISFFGHLLLPAKGPIIHHEGDFQNALEGKFWYDAVKLAIWRIGGPHGAFPSLHIAVSSFLMMFDMKYNRLRGMIYLPLVFLIAISTLVLRYHYVIDLFVGFGVAVIALIAAEMLSRKFPTTFAKMQDEGLWGVGEEE